MTRPPHLKSKHLESNYAPLKSAPASGARLAAANSFGMPKSTLKWVRDSEVIAARHKRYLAAAENYLTRYARKGRYGLMPSEVMTSDGSFVEKMVLVPIEKPRAERYLKWQTKRGKEAQAKANDFWRFWLNQVGKNRTTGSSYGVDPSVTELFTGRKTEVANGPNAFINTAEGINSANTLGASIAETGSSITQLGDALGAASLGINGLDVILVSDPLLKTLQLRRDAKDTLVRVRHLCENFLQHLGAATVAEADAYLNFIAAGDLVVNTNMEDQAAWTTHKLRFGRVAGLFGNSTIGAGIEIANTVTSVVPGANIVGATIGTATAAVDLPEARNEHLRRQGQIELIEMRKARMQELVTRGGRIRRSLLGKELAPMDAQPERVLLGLIDGLQKSQDVLMIIARREKGFARIQAGKAATNAELGALGIVLGAVSLAGVFTAPVTFGTTLALSAGVAAVWAGLLAYRDNKRGDDETDRKRLQRAAGILSYAKNREELEAMVTENKPVTVVYGEGDHTGEGQFAGLRAVSFYPQENPYLIFQLLAYQLRDLVQTGKYEVNSPFFQLLHHGLGIDQLHLLAICKVASAKDGHAQMDYLQAHLAKAAGWKFSVGADGQQAPPHESFFVNEFKAACQKVVSDPTGTQDDYWDDVRLQLMNSLNGEGAMDAFVNGVKTYLERTRGDDRSIGGLWAQLEDFSRWLEVQLHKEKPSLQAKSASRGDSSLSSLVGSSESDQGTDTTDSDIEFLDRLWAKMDAPDDAEAPPLGRPSDLQQPPVSVSERKTAIDAARRRPLQRRDAVRPQGPGQEVVANLRKNFEPKVSNKTERGRSSPATLRTSLLMQPQVPVADLRQNFEPLKQNFEPRAPRKPED